DYYTSGEMCESSIGTISVAFGCVKPWLACGVLNSHVLNDAGSRDRTSGGPPIVCHVWMRYGPPSGILYLLPEAANRFNLSQDRPIRQFNSISDALRFPLCLPPEIGANYAAIMDNQMPYLDESGYRSLDRCGLKDILYAINPLEVGTNACCVVRLEGLCQQLRFRYSDFATVPS